MKKLITAVISLVLIAALALLAGCGAIVPTADAGTAPTADAGTTPTAEKTAAAPLSTDTSAASGGYDTAVSNRDASGEYDASAAVTLSPDGDLTVTEAGVYLLSGTYEGKTLVVDAGEDAKVQLVLAGAAITNDGGPAIYVRSADKVFLTAAAGTENLISDGADYTYTDGDTEADAAVFSRDDLTLNGAGKLTIIGSNKHAVVSKDDLAVTAENLTVIAKNVGLNGKDSVRISNAGVTITAGTDGVRADNAEDADRSYVSVEASVLTVTAGNDGIQAETAFLADDSAVTVTAGGGSGAGSGSDSESRKGIKAGLSVQIDGGTFRIDAADDAIHTNGTVTISGGEFTLASGDDAIHADEKVEISGGSLAIAAAEGIEGTCVLISGGEIVIQATDDGINAARKSAALTPTVEITGGTVTITMGPGDTDGIDSNGNIVISGGTVSVTGNSTFDYDGTASFTGGTVYVNGQQVTALPNQMMGGGMGGMGGMGGHGGRPRY